MLTVVSRILGMPIRPIRFGNLTASSHEALGTAGLHPQSLAKWHADAELLLQ